MTGTALALHATVFVSVVVGVPVAWRAVRSSPPVPPPGGRIVGPGWWLGVVAAVLFFNQVLFTVYAVRVHGGDMSYLGGYVPDGWFVIADLGPVTAHWPAPGLLAFSALRLPSLFELPLGMLAVLTVVNWLDPSLYRRVTSVAVLALTSASYTITFGLIEWAMHTTYAVEDLVLRAVSGVLTVVALRGVARRRSAPSQVFAPRTTGEFLAFAASTAALGFLILAMYDSVLLYSLGKVGQHVLGAALAAVVLAASRYAAAHLRRRPGPPPAPVQPSPTPPMARRAPESVAPGAQVVADSVPLGAGAVWPRPAPASAGAGLKTLTSGLSWWLALFMIPALAIRYELGFGSRLFAAAAGLLVIGAATIAALSQVYAELPATGRPTATRHWLLALAVAVAAASAASLAGFAVPAYHQEIRLLWGGAFFILTATAVITAWDHRYPSTKPPTPAEAH